MTISFSLNPVSIVLLVILFILGISATWFLSNNRLEGSRRGRLTLAFLWPIMLPVIGVAVLLTVILWPEDLQ